MAAYTIEPARDTLHGTFSREYPPILTIDSGDTVLFRTLNSGWVLEPPSFKNANVKHFEPRIEGRDDGTNCHDHKHLPWPALSWICV